jgi:hypothetical protein
VAVLASTPPSSTAPPSAPPPAAAHHPHGDRRLRDCRHNDYLAGGPYAAMSRSDPRRAPVAAAMAASCLRRPAVPGGRGARSTRAPTATAAPRPQTTILVAGSSRLHRRHDHRSRGTLL